MEGLKRCVVRCCMTVWCCSEVLWGGGRRRYLAGFLPPRVDAPRWCRNQVGQMGERPPPPRTGDQMRPWRAAAALAGHCNMQITDLQGPGKVIRGDSQGGGLGGQKGGSECSGGGVPMHARAYASCV